MTQSAMNKVAPKQPITVELLLIMTEEWSVQGAGRDQKMLWVSGITLLLWIPTIGRNNHSIQWGHRRNLAFGLQGYNSSGSMNHPQW